MWTDVYLDEDIDEYYTITNDTDLIEYVKSIDSSVKIRNY